uniref:Uncharacterized protein n=1 Tax=Tanacetum cinerariifolium TaxID=118510 RepID=A0A699HBQ2_TANCI|nr:hypothetical protein [Tanacetum cinerariifolium]
MKIIDNISKAGIDERAKLLKALNRVFETLEADSILKEEMQKMVEFYNTTSGNLSGLTKLINNAILLEPLTKLEGFQSTLNTLSTQWMVTEMLQAFKGMSSSTYYGSASILKAPQPKVHVSVRGENFKKQINNLTNDEIQEYLNKEEKIKKKAKHAKLLEMIKTKITKVVHKEVEKARIDLKIVLNTKGGGQFKKIQDAKHQVHKRQHTKKSKRLMELKNKRTNQYMWTISNRLRLKPISYVKIHPNLKPVVLIVYRANDRRNFQVHNPSKYTNFRVTELDELGLFIQKKKNKIVGKVMTSLGKRKRKHFKLEPEIIVLGLECNQILRENVSFVNNMVIEEPEYLMFFIDVLGELAF